MTPGDPSAKNWPPIPTKKSVREDRARVAGYHPDRTIGLPEKEREELAERYKVEMPQVRDTARWLDDEAEENVSGNSSVSEPEKQVQLEDMTTYPVPAVYKGEQVPAKPSTEQVPAAAEEAQLPVIARGSAVMEAQAASETGAEDGAPPAGNIELVGVVGRKLESEQREAVLRRLNHVQEEAIDTSQEETSAAVGGPEGVAMLEAPPAEGQEGQPPAAVETGAIHAAENPTTASSGAQAASAEPAHNDHHGDHGHGSKNPFMKGLLRGWAIGMGVGLVIINGLIKFFTAIGKNIFGFFGIKGGGKTESHDDGHGDHGHADAHAGGH